MKRKIAAMLVMTMALGITACGGSGNEAPAAATAAEAASEEAASEEAVAPEEEAAPEEAAPEETATEEAEEVALGEDAGASTEKNAGKDSGSSIFKQDTAEEEETAEEKEPEKEETKADTKKEDTEKKSGPVKMAYSLEKVGEVPADAGYVRTYADALINVANDNTFRMLTPEGKDALGVDLTNIEYLGHGLYVVRKVADNINNAGLVTAEGEVLIDFEAGLISWPKSLYSDTDRFLSVIYTTGETDSEDDAIMYATDSLFSFTPSEDDTLYTGYRRVFDLQTGKFVENAENTTGDSYSVTPCGGSFFMVGDDGKNRLYSAEGKVIMEPTGYVSYIGNGSFLISDNGYHIYDETGKETYTSDSYLNMLQGPSNFYYYEDKDSEETVLIDKNGKEVGRIEANSLYEEAGEGVIRIKSNGGAYQLVDLKGNVLFDTGAESISQTDKLPGSFYSSKGDGFNYYLADGRTGTIEKGYGFNFIGTDKGEKAYYCFADEDYTIKPGERSSYGEFPGTLESGASYSQSGLIDCFTGETLLEERYSTISKIGHYLAAEDGETGNWEIYKVTGPIGD